MSAKRYRILGYVVWQGGKWYLRKRAPSARALALGGAAAAAGIAAVGALGKRLSG